MVRFLVRSDVDCENRCVATVSRDIYVFHKKTFGRMDVQIIMVQNALEALSAPGFGRYGEGAVV